MMWLNYKVGAFTYKVDLSKVEVMSFNEKIIHLWLNYSTNTSVGILREYNDNFDEILEKLINL